MSNLIKAPLVHVDREDSVVIGETNPQPEQPVEQQKKRHVFLKSLEEYERELELEKILDKAENKEGNDSEFEAGIPVKNFDEIFEEQRDKVEHEIEEMMRKAREDAQKIIDEATQSADSVRQAAYEEGKQQGYDAGIVEGNQQIAAMQEELEESHQQKMQEYERMVSELEPKFAEVLCGLLQKLTGAVMTDQKEVLVYLIHRAMFDIEASPKYILRVSTDDLVYVENHKDEIISKSGVDGIVEVQEEKGLTSGQCILETDTQMMDCGFQTQLGNLITTIRMLSR